MSAFLDEATLEQAVLDLFGELGYRTAYGPDIGPNGNRPERASYAEVILPGRLRASLETVNPGLPPSAIDAAIGQLTRSEGGTYIEENRRFHAFLTDGVAVEFIGRDGQITHGLVRLFDFDDPERNDWLVVNQYTVAERATGKVHTDRRPDVVVFVNGLPLAVLELKNPKDVQATVRKAYNQLQVYKQYQPDLFVTNELLAVTDGFEAKLGTLSADWERFAPWKTINGEEPGLVPPPQYEVLLRGVFDRRWFLEILRGFVVFDDGPQALVKKVAGYHQYDAVRCAVRKTVEAVERPRDHRIGVVWHTQGSGKSLTMVFYAGRLIAHPALANPTLVILTDRNDLDSQLYGTFTACQELLRQEPVQAEDRADLRRLLSVASGGVIFTTIQKFMPDQRGDRHPVLCDRRNVVVIADEAHRSQYSFAANLRLDLKKEEAHLGYGFAQHLRDALPAAAFVGFTGTPVETEDRITTNVFGPCIDVYDIEQAVKDGATVPIYYESRLAKLELDELVKGELDEEFEDATEEADERERRKLATKWAALEALVGAEERVERIAADIVQHFEARRAALPGKALVVAISRRVCVALYKAIVALRPDWAGESDEQGAIKVVMTGHPSESVDYAPHIRTKRQLDRVAARLKDPKDPLALVIVCDMWLTGFDVPCLHTMYLDKPLKAHGLMQAIARVNRVHGVKPSGLVVDYLGLAAELKAALRTYTAGGGRGKPTLDQKEAVKVLQEKLEVVRGMMFGLDYMACLKGTPAERLARTASCARPTSCTAASPWRRRPTRPWRCATRSASSRRCGRTS
jgi:type I restriction enzyme R subunit